MRRLWISITTLLIIPFCAIAQQDEPEAFGQGICITMEMDSILRATNPSADALDGFEANFQREIARYKVSAAQHDLPSDRESSFAFACFVACKS